MLVNWWEVTKDALINLLQGFGVFIPKLIGALIVFIIGWIVAVIVGKLVAELLRKVNFNKIFEKGTWKAALEKADFKVDASGFVGALLKWVLVIVFLSAAVEILGLVQFAGFVNSVLAYLPNVIIAALIFVVAVIIADIAEKIVRASVEGIKVGYGQLVGAIVKWSIWVFSIFMILEQLQIGKGMITTLMQGIVGLIVIAGGIAFGLGGKDVAADILRNLKKKIEE
jgi:hypothetical protein